MASKETIFEVPPNKGLNYTMGILFIVISAVLFSCYLILPSKDRSPAERRADLQDFPKVSFETIFAKRTEALSDEELAEVNSNDGPYNFMEYFKTYAEDQFPGRVTWMRIKTISDVVLGRNRFEAGGSAVYRSDGRLLPDSDYSYMQNAVNDAGVPVVSNYNANLAAINRISSTGERNYYLALVPTSSTVYNDRLPSYVTVPNEVETVFPDMLAKAGVGENLTYLNLYEALYANRDEYIYYRTDHHWTSLGAYYAYQSMMAGMGRTAVDQRAFTIGQATDGFYGAYYNTAFGINVQADTMETWVPTGQPLQVTIDGSSTYDSLRAKTSDSLYFPEALEADYPAMDPYDYYLAGNQAYVKIVNPAITDGSKVLVAVDSYAHGMVQFLSASFGEVHYLDYRLIDFRRDGVEKYAALHGIDDVVFMFCSDGLNRTKIG